MASNSKNNLSSSLIIEDSPDLVSRTSDSPFSPITSPNNHVSSILTNDIRQMTCSSPIRQQQQHTNLTVLDVYDEATLIRKDFERIVETYGAETIVDLVPKVIHILELLEFQAAKNEKQIDEVLSMKARIERLETEKLQTRELRKKYDHEMERNVDQWQKEEENLMTVVSKLQDENRRLRDELTRNNNNNNNKTDLSTPTETVSITREELQCIKKLTEENVKFKRILKSKEKELIQKTIDMEAIQDQLKRICTLNCTLRQKNIFSTNQSQRLMLEKCDLEVQLKEKENYINHMKDRVGDDLTSPTTSINPIDEFASMDPNRPRFTLEELRQVLWERNDLKTKLFEVEEELRIFKEQEDNENAPVEGPIPLEPDEKLYGSKRDDSKVRQLLSSITLKPVINILRSFFPPSRKGSVSEQNTPSSSSTMPLTPKTPSLNASRSYSTFSSPSIEPNESISTKISIENRKTPKTNIPLLSPPASK